MLSLVAPLWSPDRAWRALAVNRNPGSYTAGLFACKSVFVFCYEKVLLFAFDRSCKLL